MHTQQIHLHTNKKFFITFIRNYINNSFQLLVEMDGMGSAEDVILLASTNRADVLDKVRGRKLFYLLSTGIK